ncbi:MAG: DUF1343 domain-containing protein [Bacteroidales bacterium]|nr:DUF1343 domain-containing protein [Bacteroidales bacterium]MDD4385625.1 DUF1343 domain-containing protein [Bacteroidales bacterium]MDY0198204.1 DUF1343 domain-containing protein [Tenuifilaceae bacterium]
MKALILLIVFAALSSCAPKPPNIDEQGVSIKLGCEQTSQYLPLIKGKRVGIVANHSTVINQTHLVDSLLKLNINIVKIFSPEHGFRGQMDAGEIITNHIDSITELPVVSLYGANKKPSHADFKDIDVIIFDMQDVGVRIYTYISTMHYVMETCAETGTPLIVLDRPNPNGFYVDGPMLDTNYRSFVGMHPVPLVHGMTIGEFSQMINGEGWLSGAVSCDLKVIACKNYTHDSTYVLPTRPSPNLPNQTAVYLYPSLGFFEGTVISVGRGTDYPFQIFGHPSLSAMEYKFTPVSTPGASKTPLYQDQLCSGVDLRDYNAHYFTELRQVNLSWLMYAYQSFPNKDKFFNSYFNTLVGSKKLRESLENGDSELKIKETWQSEIANFLPIRKKYLLYPDFSLLDDVK